jgi:hypothetical protein
MNKNENKINLHSIFRYIVNDPKFLSSYIENNQVETIATSKVKEVVKITEYVPLAIGEVHKFSKFPILVQKILSYNHYSRLGVRSTLYENKNTSQEIKIPDVKPHNISFVASLNTLLIPESHKLNANIQCTQINNLENLIIDRIKNNHQIDKIKNTKKMQQHNKQLAQTFTDGILNQEIINRIVNIFEINLLVFDLTNHKPIIQFYWTHGTKQPYVNLLRDIYCMVKIGDTYEPLIVDHKLPEKEKQLLYCKILYLSDHIDTEPLILNLITLQVLNMWKIDFELYQGILRKHYKDYYKHCSNIIDIIKVQMIKSGRIKIKPKAFK